MSLLCTFLMAQLVYDICYVIRLDISHNYTYLDILYNYKAQIGTSCTETVTQVTLEIMTCKGDRNQKENTDSLC